MPHLQRLILHPLVTKIVLCLLAIMYLVYLVAFVRSVYTSLSAPSQVISEHSVAMNPAAVVKHWTMASMRNATNADQLIGKAAQQQGQPPRNGEPSYPLSTVGKVFFTTNAGQDLVCSGTAVASLNQSVVDTAGHCLHWNGDWVKNVIFCPLYENGNTPYGCWAARDLEVPSDWIGAKPNDLHHDFGMAIVAPNSQGALTDLVGGAGWAYNQSVSQPFSAYGYPAGYPFDGQTRVSCEGSSGTAWKHGGGTVVSIPCNWDVAPSLQQYKFGVLRRIYYRQSDSDQFRGPRPIERDKGDR